jgi:16S rRNA (adenine1518-N6/adenine1519-N6)-dimethyltransferase
MRLKKHLGQHFLKDRAVLKKILAAAELSGDDIVLEIGGGTGVLTKALASRAGKVIAIEKDPSLCKLLQKKFLSAGLAKSRGPSQVQIICTDILKFNPSRYKIQDTRYKIAANIPYYLTGRLLRKIFEEWPAPKLTVLMLQKEVAERICAKPPKMSLASASVQFFAKPKIMARVPKTAFSPQPKVNSAIIKLTPRSVIGNQLSVPTLSGRDSDRSVGVSSYFAIVRAGFRQPRKLLASNLAKKYPKSMALEALTALGIPASSRPAELSVEQWMQLAEKIENRWATRNSVVQYPTAETRLTLSAQIHQNSSCWDSP